MSCADAQFIALGAPNEKSQLEEFRRLAAAEQIPVDVAILSLEGVYSLMHLTDLIVTGDTSIKHLAALTPIRVVEIALGSADRERTGAYKDGALILSSRERCAPCPHSQPCHRDSHACAEHLDPVLVGMAIGKYLQRDWAALKTLAQEYVDEVMMTRAVTSVGGFWMPVALHEENVAGQVAAYVDRVAWRFLLNKEYQRPLAAFGSEGVRLKNWLEDMGGATTPKERILPSISELENVTRLREERINRTIKDVSRKIRDTGTTINADFVDSDFGLEIAALENELGLGQYLSEKLQLSPEFGLFRARQLQTSLNEVHTHQQIKLKLIRTLRQMIGELT
jgi:hypothetical protein